MSATSSMWTTRPPTRAECACCGRDTRPAIPRPPRVPTATNWRHVEEVRYDLAHATAVGLASALGRVTTPFHYPDAEAVYGGLEAGESDALCLARVELCEWADRLGRL